MGDPPLEITVNSVGELRRNRTYMMKCSRQVDSNELVVIAQLLNQIQDRVGCKIIFVSNEMSLMSAEDLKNNPRLLAHLRNLLKEMPQ